MIVGLFCSTKSMIPLATLRSAPYLQEWQIAET
ncbi:Uncharacterised protein [Mycobacteroides abscessus subsp. abscessus]|nr:Uncharacterised protein [Mycobacteroides abscessus subsp. abscessus]